MGGEHAWALVPFEGGGQPGLVGGAAAPDHPEIRGLLAASPLPSGFRAVLGPRGSGLALRSLPWDVRLATPESTPAARLRLGLVAGLAAVVAGIFAWGAVRSLTVPLAHLGASAAGIAAGQLDAPIPDQGGDEIGRLGRALESMRHALVRARDAERHRQEELTRLVRERTAELSAANQALAEREALRLRLLRRTISAQEEERRRIARELHDETCQEIVALGLGLDAAQADPADLHPRLLALRPVVDRALHGVHRLIHDLRPSVLDDLGTWPPRASPCGGRRRSCPCGSPPPRRRPCSGPGRRPSSTSPATRGRTPCSSRWAWGATC
jgi:HAMP domain-containing protein